jgi:3-oxoacyl-[acyl-carrier protein] reductase
VLPEHLILFFSMSDKHILITGASRGIGEATARYLASRDIHVTVAARTTQRLEALGASNRELIHPLSVDLTEAGSGVHIRSFIEELNRPLTGIIHNAGLLINKPFRELSDDDWNQQIEVNLMAPVRLTRDLLPVLSSLSHIIFISSMGGFQGSSKFPGLSAYSATKGALSVLSECLAAELAADDIACNTLCLGAVQTEMLEQAFPGIQAPVSPAQMGEYVGEFALTAHQFYNGQVLPVTLGNPE